MIGTIDIAVQSANPQMPLNPMYAFKESPSSIRIRNVPKRIGKWNITRVYVKAEYPDHTTKIVDATLIGGVYVATIEASSESGTTANGLTILADGVDENNNTTTGYVLGKGDIYILEADEQFTLGPWTTHLYGELPENPREGDCYIDEGVLKVYDGSEWKQTLTKVSQIQNDTGFITGVSWNDVMNKPSVALTTDILDEASARQNADADLQEQIDDIAGNRAVPKVLSDWLYELDFDDTYDAFGTEWRREHFVDAGACTSIFGGSPYQRVLFGRNYDWKYSDEAIFVVRTPRRGSLYASVGVASLGSYLTRTMVDSGEYTNIYKALPTMLQDGVNEKGLCASIHVVKSNPDKDAGWTGTGLDAFGAIRYVLDFYDNAQEAAEWIAENVYIPTKFKEETGYSVQFMLASDNTKHYIVQDGVAHEVLGSDALTNFRLYDPSGTRHTSRSEVAVYDPYGQGIERMEIFNSTFQDVSQIRGMRNVLNAVNFTNAYNTEATTPWISEFVDEELGLSLSSPDEDFEDVRNIAKLAFDGRDRFHPTHIEYKGEEYDVETWQTVHSSIYDLVAKTLRIIVQEGTEEYVFKCEFESTLENYYTKSEVDDALNEKANASDVPTKTSQLTNDSGFLTQHQSLDNYYTKSQTYSQQEVDTKLDGKANASDIPTVNNPTITLTQGGTTKGTFTLNQSGDKTIDLDAGGGQEKITVAWCIHDWDNVSSNQWARIGDLSLTFGSTYNSLHINGQRYSTFTDQTLPKAASGVLTSTSPIRFQTYNYGYASVGNVIVVQNGIATRYTTDIDMTISNDAQIFLYFNTCLESHTPILMADGTSKAIKDIMLGDKVMSLNPDTMELEEDEVVDCDSGSKKMSYEKDVWNFADGTVLETIHPHQFYNVRLGRMEYIANFKIGDEVLKADGHTKTALVSHQVEEGIFFHNTLFTRKFNNYFANGILSGNRHSRKFGWYWIGQHN